MMQDGAGLCRLHGPGLKPSEGRAATHDTDPPFHRSDIARLWNTDRGREVVERWRKFTGYTGTPGDSNLI